MPYLTLVYEKRSAIAYIRINRPEKLNALNRQVMQELFDCFQTVQHDDDVRAVIITGSGEKAFVAGADIGDMAALSPAEGQEFSRFGHKVLHLIENLGKPVIAAINGFTLGGGCEIAMACTLRIAAENARLGQPEVKLGLICGYGGSQRLPRLVGKGRALELLLTGEPITAAEAHRIGLVNQVVPGAELLATCEKIAQKILANGPLAVQRTMEAVNHGMETTLEEGEFLEATLFAFCCASSDMKEGTTAFLEKRPAKFTGR